MSSETPPRPQTPTIEATGRDKTVVIAELRGLGGLVLEQALMDGPGQPLPSLVAWGNRLARELGVDGLGAPATYRELMAGVASVNRRAGAGPA